MKLFKLTDWQGCTVGRTQWGEGVKHSVAEEDRKAELCSSGVLHAYTNAALGLLLNPIHADFERLTVQLWEAEGELAVSDWGKVGCFELATVRRLDLPEWYVDDALFLKVAVRFAQLCADAAARYAADDARYADAAARYAADDARYAADAARYAADAAAHYAAAASGALVVDMVETAERAVAEVMCERHMY